MEIKIILVRPQLSSNIGSVARVMMNFDCEDLRLVEPKANWLDENALAISAGGKAILDNAKIYNSLHEAAADLNLSLALTARSRYINKPALNVDKLNLYLNQNTGASVGLIFGPENSGLSNEDLVYAQKTIHIPTSPIYSSLNLSHAVAITLHEALKKETLSKPNVKTSPPATLDEVYHLLIDLENNLGKTDFLRVSEKKANMLRNIKNIFMRIENLSSQEVSTLRGIISALASK